MYINAKEGNPNNRATLFRLNNLLTYLKYRVLRRYFALRLITIPFA